MQTISSHCRASLIDSRFSQHAAPDPELTWRHSLSVKLSWRHSSICQLDDIQALLKDQVIKSCSLHTSLVIMRLYCSGLRQILLGRCCANGLSGQTWCCRGERMVNRGDSKQFAPIHQSIVRKGHFVILLRSADDIVQRNLWLLRSQVTEGGFD
jgi:hypothetical protein